MKKVQKTLTGAMAAVMATGMATPVMAAPADVDAIYKAAYNATMKALQTKTQEAVNEARVAIKALPATLESAIGEFSKQLDTVQHPILVNIVTAIKAAQTTPNQANVNAAKASLVKGLPQVWLNSYSSAVDVVQQDLMNKVVTAVKLAETSKKAADVEAAKKLVADLATATSEAIKTVATGLKTRVEAVKVYALDVTKVSEFDLDGFEIEFTALEEALRDGTVEVIDNKGNVVSVKKLSLLVEEETFAIVEFTTPLTTRGTGIWTVNGVEVNLDHVNLIADLANPSKTTNGEAVYQLLSKSGLIKNVIDKVINHTAYYDTFTGVDVEFETVEDVQKLVDKANASLVSSDVIAKIVKIAVDEDDEYTIRQFKSALETVTLERVNADWIEAYREEITTSVKTLKDLQAVINDVNADEVTDAIEETDVTGEEKLVEKTINKAISLVKEYHVNDEKKETVKAEKLAALEMKLALAKIEAADTQASLKSALKAYYNLLDETRVYEKEVTEVNMASYVTVNKTLVINGQGTNTVETLLTNGNSAAKTAAETAINDAADVIADLVAADKTVEAKHTTALLNAFNKLAAVTASDSTPFSVKDLEEDNLEAYALGLTRTTNKLTIAEVIEEVNDEVNSSTVTKAIKDANTDTKLLAALKSLGIKNLVDGNKAKYDSVIDQENVNKMSDLQNAVNYINSLVTINGSKDVNTVSKAILEIALNKGTTALGLYINTAKTASVRNDVAELVIRDMTINKTTYATVEDLSIAIMTETTGFAAKAISNVTLVNDAETNTDMIAALIAVDPSFANLDAVAQLEKVEKVFEFLAKTNDKGEKINSFKNFTEVRNVLK